LDQSATTHRVSAAIWRWRETAASPAAETPELRRKRALVESTIGGSVGLLLLLVFRKPLMAAVVFTISALVLTGGLFVPPIYHGFKKAGQWLAAGVGHGLTWLLLAPFFFIVFGIGRLVLVLSGRDPLCRRCSPDEPTYWVPHRRPPGADPYRRQY